MGKNCKVFFAYKLAKSFHSMLWIFKAEFYLTMARLEQTKFSKADKLIIFQYINIL